MCHPTNNHKYICMQALQILLSSPNQIYESPELAEIHMIEDKGLYIQEKNIICFLKCSLEIIILHYNHVH